MHGVEDPVASLLADQAGLVTRGQLLSAGVGADAIRWRTGRAWRIVLPGVLATFTGELTWRHRLIAAQLWAGPAAALASFTAVRWHDVGDVPPDGLVRVLVPHPQNPRRHSFVVARRTARPDAHPWSRPPLMICSRPRALVDAARELRTHERARSLLIEAVQRRHVRECDLWEELEAGAIRGSAHVRTALREVSTGAWSPPESDALSLLAASPRLPHVWPNPVLEAPGKVVLPSPDGWIDEVGLAIQVHSRRYHLRDDDWESTVEAGTVLGEYGVPVVGTTPTALRDDPARFVRRVESAYAHLLRAGSRPRVAMRPRGPGLVR